MRYVVSYDLLNNPSREDYERIITAIQQLGGHRILFSQWVMRRHGTSAPAIRDSLRPYIRTGDRLLVTCLDNNDWAGWNLETDPNSI